MIKCSLTNLSIAAGCGCKIDSKKLARILENTSKSQMNNHNPNIISGFDNNEDCAVYDNGENYLLFTTDFFTPLIDDHRIYGISCATNALSDIYAMGGTPVIASSILGFPEEKIDLEEIGKMIDGSNEIMKQASCVVLGGHTINNPQPFYGFSIIGTVKKENLKRNHGVQDGDVLLISKPIGTGIYSTAHKLGLLSAGQEQELIANLSGLNKEGEKLGKIKGIHAMTDVTGFGLIGHIIEMCKDTDLLLNLHLNNIPFLTATHELAQATITPTSGLNKNFIAFNNSVQVISKNVQEQVMALYDPQSCGGLLVAVSRKDLDEALKVFNGSAHIIGEFKSYTDSVQKHKIAII